MAEIDYSEIYGLSNAGAYKRALTRLLNEGRSRIRPPYSGDLNHAWYLTGDLYYKLGCIDEALKAFKRSLANWSEDTEAMMAIANCYSLLSRPRWAVYYLRKALELDPDNRNLVYNLGNAYLDCGSYDAATRAYRKALLGASEELSRMIRRNIKIASDRVAK